jgi:hypothetical protein
MQLTQLFLGELDREAARTRRAIDRVPEGRDDWKPHDKSMPLGRLAGLVATMPAWLKMIIERDDLDLNPPGGSSTAEDPRHIVLRDAINHLAHHRGQLTVYLRLNDIPVPSIYGPTADDERFL